jgi:hypothetical protein
VSGALDGSPDVALRRGRLGALCSALPEAETEPIGRRREHLAFKVRKKIFAYYVYDHHGDGRIALWCKAPPGEQASLVAESPRRHFVPPYVGPRGWVGVRLDTPTVDWRAVKQLVIVAYFLTAPDSLRKKPRSAAPRRRATSRRRQPSRKRRPGATGR